MTEKNTNSISAMELSEGFIRTTVIPDAEENLPELFPFMALGLVGDGSECFGYDDKISRDHDWGIDFYIWVPKDKSSAISSIRKWKENIFVKYWDYLPVQHKSAYGVHRDVMTIDSFYSRLTGFDEGPKTYQEYLNTAEERLFLATNGKVFVDEKGDFSAIRRRLQLGFPNDIRLYKIAIDCMMLAQTGQYNLKRCVARGDDLARLDTLARFIRYVASILCHLKNRYRPYYKWLYRFALEEERELQTLCRQLSYIQGEDFNLLEAERLINEILHIISIYLKLDDLTDYEGEYFLGHGESVMAKIKDEEIRKMAPYQIG